MMGILTNAFGPMRVGAILVAVGAIGIALTARLATGWWLITYGADAASLLAGAMVWRGNAPVMRLVRSVMAFGTGATVAGLLGLAVVRPLDLTLTEVRLDPTSFVWPAVIVVVAFCVQIWITWELGREPVRAALTEAGLRRWDPATAAKAGTAAMFVAIVLAWAALHGNSASVAVTLAEQQLGPDYRYALTWISAASRDGRSGVDGVVTAWNSHEVRTVLMHWDKR
jgi:hypothetical protein